MKQTTDKSTAKQIIALHTYASHNIVLKTYIYIQKQDN